mgnify:CR=1 FL=1
MARILGLDLGTNSIGWALIDDVQNKIIGMGSRIFPMGVENLGEGEGREMSKNATRTGARGVRRQFFRRRLRKKILLKVKFSSNIFYNFIYINLSFIYKLFITTFTARRT